MTAAPVPFSELAFVDAPDRQAFPVDPLAFVTALGRPTAMRIPGRDRSRCRAIVTLLHGNEPSGSAALAAWLASGRVPAVDTLLVFASVHAALHGAPFEHRTVPGERDLNRTFRAPFGDDRPGRLAREILALIDRHAPECVIDVHNTSGVSPSFGVVTHEHPAHEWLVARFSKRVIVTDLKLGSLMETTRASRPVVTVECGGALSTESVEVARAGIERLLETTMLYTADDAHSNLDVYHHPVRIEFAESTRFVFADAPDKGTDVTVPRDIERLNFGLVAPGTPIVWLGAKGLDAVVVRDAEGRDVVGRYFVAESGAMTTVAPMKLFMVTTNAAIARSDCLCYAALETGHTRLDLSDADTVATP